MTPPLRSDDPILQKYLNDPVFQQEARDFAKLIPEFKIPEQVKLDPVKLQEIFENIKSFGTKTITWGSPFAARYLGPIESFLARSGAPAFMGSAVTTLGAPVSTLSAGEIAGPVGVAALVGVGTGVFINYELPKAGDWLGEKAFDIFGPPAADSWVWNLDTPFINAFDSKKEVGDVIAKGIVATCGSPSQGTMDVLDKMGFGGWEVFKNSWGL